jgi:diacylglycerol kinase family enzyme
MLKNSFLLVILEEPMRGLTATLVYNPNSGKRRASDLAKRFQELWQERTGTTAKLRPTRSLQDIRIAAKETAHQSDVVVFLGGDGTFSEALQGLFEFTDFHSPAKPIGLLPAGTGNSFLRDFGITGFDSAFASLCQSLEKKQPFTADIGLLSYRLNDKIHRRIVMNIWGIGFIPAVTKLAIKLRNIGSLNYTAATLIRLLSHKPYHYEAKIDGKAEKMCCDFVTLSNSQYTGGSMHMAPPVRVNDSHMFMVCPELKKRRRVLALFPKIFAGRHLESAAVRSQFVKEFSLTTQNPISMNVDGELEIGCNPNIKILPAAWKLWVSHPEL